MSSRWPDASATALGLAARALVPRPVPRQHAGAHRRSPTGCSRRRCARATTTSSSRRSCEYAAAYRPAASPGSAPRDRATAIRPPREPLFVRAARPRQELRVLRCRAWGAFDLSQLATPRAQRRAGMGRRSRTGDSGACSKSPPCGWPTARSSRSARAPSAARELLRFPARAASRARRGRAHRRSSAARSLTRSALQPLRDLRDAVRSILRDRPDERARAAVAAPAIRSTS